MDREVSVGLPQDELLDLILKSIATAKLLIEQTPPAAIYAAIQAARAQLDPIRTLMGRIQDPAAWKRIHREAESLDAAIMNVLRSNHQLKKAAGTLSR